MQKTFCRICEAHCGLLAESDAGGALKKLRPDPDHPISGGFVCAKGLRFLDIADHPDRLTQPQRRNPDGSLAATTWEHAYAKIGDKLARIRDQHGPHAVAVYFGTPMIHNALGMLALFAWVRALGTRNLYSAASQDNSNKLFAQKIIHGSEWTMPIMDIEHADFALLLGTNPVVSQGTFVHTPGGTRAYDAFLKRGGEMVIVDPRASESVKRWGGHLRIYPGTDVFLLLAILRELRELRPKRAAPGLDELLALAEPFPPARAASLTGVPAATIRDLAHKLRSAERATLFNGVGVNQGPFGTLCVILIQAIAYLTGNFDEQGGILFHPWANILQPLVGLSPQTSRIGNFTSHAGGLPCGILADEILTAGDGQIRALIVVGGNPLTSTPEEAKMRRAFASLDLLVSIDIFENHTGKLADFLLPGATWLERFDIGAWDAMYETAPMLQTSPRLREPVGDCRTEAQIIADLSLASGTPLLGVEALARLWANTDLDALAPALLKPLQWLTANPDGIPWRRARPRTYVGHEQPTFWDAALDGEADRLRTFAANLQLIDADDLLLIGRRRRLAQNSWIHNAGRAPKPRDACAWLHPDDLARLGIDDGATVEIASEAGTITIPVAANASVMAGTVTVPHGLPGVNVNRLISSDAAFIEPHSGMHQMVGHRVRVTRASVDARPPS